MTHFSHPIIFKTLTVFAIVFSVGMATADDLVQIRRDAVIVRAIQRIDGFDLDAHPEIREVLNRHLKRTQGTREFIQLVKQFQPPGVETHLIGTLLGDDLSAAVEAAEMMLELKAGRPLLIEALAGSDAVKVIRALGLLGNGDANEILASLVIDEKVSFEQRREAVAGLARTRDGQKSLIQFARNKELVGDTVLVAGALLARSEYILLRESAASVMPTPAQKDAKPLPSVDLLAKMTGDAVNGKKLFRGIATCSNCHIVADFGKEVGPNLSEIGSKLSREAMLTAILAPSAGISHNYENYTVLTDAGLVISGMKVSETDNEIVIRTADAISRRISVEDVELLEKSDKSIMPDNLHHITGQNGLLDVVEYMMTLKKKSKGGDTIALFDGSSMDDWDGDSQFWSLQDGAITGITTQDNPIEYNTFCVYKHEIEGDFELTFEYRVEGHKSGVQYRSFVLGDGATPYRIGGYQAEFDAPLKWAGTLRGEPHRGLLAKRGEKTVLTGTRIRTDVNRVVAVREVEELADASELAKSIKPFPEWNQFRIVAKGYHYQHDINGKLMIDCFDADETHRRDQGLIALQLHQGPPMKVQMKNVMLKKLK